MEKNDILIVVKTYPEISRKYTETVCTAGILADSKRLVRLYPNPDLEKVSFGGKL
jgi:hypothetical protein